MWFASNIHASIKDIGLGGYCVYLLGRVLRALSLGDAVQYCLMAVDLEKLTAAKTSSVGATLTPLKRGDPRLEALDVPMDIVVQRQDMGAICQGLCTKDDLRAWIWYVKDRYDEDEVRARFLLPPKAVWDFGAYVAPQFRVGRSFDHLWRGFASLCRAQGFVFSISRIGTHNLESMRAHKRLPHTELGYCTFIRILSLQLCISPLLARWHMSLSDQDRPVFEVHM